MARNPGWSIMLFFSFWVTGVENLPWPRRMIYAPMPGYVLMAEGLFFCVFLGFYFKYFIKQLNSIIKNRFISINKKTRARKNFNFLFCVFLFCILYSVFSILSVFYILYSVFCILIESNCFFCFSLLVSIEHIIFHCISWYSKNIKWSQWRGAMTWSYFSIASI